MLILILLVLLLFSASVCSQPAPQPLRNGTVIGTMMLTQPQQLTESLSLVGDDNSNPVIVCAASPCFMIIYTGTRPFFLNVTGVKFVVAGAIVQTNGQTSQTPIHIDFQKISCANSVSSSVGICSQITMFLLLGAVKSLTLQEFSVTAVHTMLQLQSNTSYVESLQLENIVAKCTVTCISLRSLSPTAQVSSVTLQEVDLNSNVSTTFYIDVPISTIDTFVGNGTALFSSVVLRGVSSTIRGLASLTIQSSTIFTTLAIQNVAIVSIRDTLITGDGAGNRMEFSGCSVCSYNVTVAGATKVQPTTRSPYFMNFQGLAEVRAQFDEVRLQNVIGAISTTQNVTVTLASFDRITLYDAFLATIAVASGPVTVNRLDVSANASWVPPNTSVLGIGAMTNNYAVTLTNVRAERVPLSRGFLLCGNSTEISVINTIVDSCRTPSLVPLPQPGPTINESFAIFELRGRLPTAGVFKVRNSTFVGNTLAVIRAEGSNVEIVTSLFERNELAVSLPAGGNLKIDELSCLCNNTVNVLCAAGTQTRISDFRSKSVSCNSWECSCDWMSATTRGSTLSTTLSTASASISPNTTAQVAPVPLSMQSPLPSDTMAIIIGASVGGGLLLLSIVVLTVVCYKRKNKQPTDTVTIATAHDSVLDVSARRSDILYGDLTQMRASHAATSVYEDIGDVRGQ
jgi:hypothetical protein